MSRVLAMIEAGRAAGADDVAILAIIEAAEKAAPESIDLAAERRRAADDKRCRPRVDWSKATPRLHPKDWNRVVGEVYRRDGFVCAYCGAKEADRAWFCVDHVHPLSLGGSNELENLVVACMPCNSSKGFKLLSEWRGRI